MARVSGHGLQREGRAFDESGRYIGGKTGYGLCACGERSPYCYSTARRQSWHVWHKQQIVAEQQGPPRS